MTHEIEDLCKDSFMIDQDIHTVCSNLKDYSFEDQTVLVTGGAGFLGSWTCNVLLEKNARVICLDIIRRAQIRPAHSS